MTGRIDVRGREDRYELPLGLTSVTLENTSGCEIEAFADVRDLTDGTVLVGQRPLCGGTFGPYELPERTHRYAVVVDSYTLKTGPYGFTLR